jgi:cytidylate kinase
MIRIGGVPRTCIVQIICVSRGTYAGGKRLAEKLADSLGYQHYSREELTDAATAAGIRVGHLEMAVVRRQPFGERLAIEMARYRAFVTASLCERALEESLVYDGRTAHLVLPGVVQALRIHVIQEPEHRINTTMHRLGLSREKARKYVEQVDEDRRRWVRTFYDVDWHDPQLYDLVINLSHTNVDNAAMGLLTMAQLPDFQLTPASTQLMRDLLLAARCRLAVGSDSRTKEMDVKIRADNGRVWVTYLPRQRRYADALPDALAGVEGIEELLCTMATTNLLWIQECFKPECEFLPNVLDIAGRWNAAVELVQLGGCAVDGAETKEEEEEEVPAAESAEDGGILDEGPGDSPPELDPGLVKTHEKLVIAGHAGGYRIVAGDERELVNDLGRGSSYSLVVLGEVFGAKAPGSRKRLTRELAGVLSDRLRIPVIGMEDLKSQYLFGRAQLTKLVLCGVPAILLALLLLDNQGAVLRFMSREGTGHRILATVLLLAFAPVFSYLYGSFTRMLLRLLKFE